MGWWRETQSRTATRAVTFAVAGWLGLHAATAVAEEVRVLNWKG